MKLLWSIIERKARQHAMELPKGLRRMSVDGPVLYKCIVCGQDTEWEGLIEEWHEDGDNMAYCGGSPRCCP